MLKSTYYDLNLMEGSDLMNPLIIDRPNYEKIDEVMHDNASAAVQTATELYDSGLKVHVLTLSNPSSVFRFVATSAYTTGDTFTVNGQQVTALLPSGETLSTGAYVINSTVLCALNGTVLTLYLGSGTVSLANDSARLGGQLPDYYATSVEVQGATALAESASLIANETKNSTGMDIIWRNTNTEAAFPLTTLTLDLSAYRVLKIVFRLSTTNPQVTMTEIPVEENQIGGVTNITIESTNRVHLTGRTFSIGTNKASIAFYNGYEKLSSPYAQGDATNTIMIPERIYGIK